jgi:hypothetical protein
MSPFFAVETLILLHYILSFPRLVLNLLRGFSLRGVIIAFVIGNLFLMHIIDRATIGGLYPFLL